MGCPGRRGGQCRRDSSGDITMLRIAIGQAAKELSWSRRISSTLYLERKDY